MIDFTAPAVSARNLPLTLGRVVATPGALYELERAGLAPAALLARHRAGDWGDVCAADDAANDAALGAGDDAGRVLSAYVLPGTGARLWVITEWDRSVTTLLSPDEY